MCFPLRGGSYRGPSNYAYHTFLPTATTEQHTFLPLIHLSLFFPVDSSLVLQPVDSCSLHLFFLISLACQRVDRTTLRNLYTIQGKQAFILSFQTLPQMGKRESPDTVRTMQWAHLHPETPLLALEQDRALRLITLDWGEEAFLGVGQRGGYNNNTTMHFHSIW